MLKVENKKRKQLVSVKLNVQLLLCNGVFDYNKKYTICFKQALTISKAVPCTVNEIKYKHHQNTKFMFFSHES